MIPPTAIAITTTAAMPDIIITFGFFLPIWRSRTVGCASLVHFDSATVGAAEVPSRSCTVASLLPMVGRCGAPARSMTVAWSACVLADAVPLAPVVICVGALPIVATWPVLYFGRSLMV